MNETKLFATPMLYWVGINANSTDPADLDAFDRHYNEVHLPEVLAMNPGFRSGARFELLRQNAGLPHGPSFLASYDLDDTAAADVYIERDRTNSRPAYTPGPQVWADKQVSWQLMYRRIATYGASPADDVHGIFLVGMNPPTGIDQDGLAEFNTFYNDVHMPEVVKYRRFTRATRYELFHEFTHPAPGCPRFLAVYEADEPTTAWLENPPQSPFSAGPPIWQGHETIWRLWYQRVLWLSGILMTFRRHCSKGHGHVDSG